MSNKSTKIQDYVNPAVYVRFAEKDDYFLAIRYPSMSFGAARFHGHHKDGEDVSPKELMDTFNLNFTASNKTKEGLMARGEYATLTYDPSSFLDKLAIATNPNILAAPFNEFLDYLQNHGATVDREVGLAVYMDTVKERLEEDGLYPPKSRSIAPKNYKVVVEVGGILINDE